MVRPCRRCGAGRGVLGGGVGVRKETHFICHAGVRVPIDGKCPKCLSDSTGQCGRLYEVGWNEAIEAAAQECAEFGDDAQKRASVELGTGRPSAAMDRTLGASVARFLANTIRALSKEETDESA